MSGTEREREHRKEGRTMGTMDRLDVLIVIRDFYGKVSWHYNVTVTDNLPN